MQNKSQLSPYDSEYICSNKSAEKQFYANIAHHEVIKTTDKKTNCFELKANTFNFN